MFKTDLARAICTIVSGTLYNVEIPVDRALYVRVRTTVKKPGSKSRGKHGYLHFVFQRPYGHSTSVWFQETTDWVFAVDNAKWQNTSNHDSEWRSDGVESPIVKVYFAHCRKVARKMAPIELETDGEIDHVAIVTVEVQREPDNYHRKLTKMMR
jgi:hypothetical protein